MEFRFLGWYLRLGSAPIAKDNFLSIQRRRSNCLLRVAALAEQFDIALTFYVEVCQSMRGGGESCWFELQRQKRTRLPTEILNGIEMVGRTRHGALYGSVGSAEISAFMNEFWLSDRFRMIGTSGIPNITVVELATALDDKTLHDMDCTLPTGVIFVLEKQHVAGEPFLVLLVDDRAENSTREVITRAAARFRHPLLVVGPGAWPPGQ